MPVATYEKKIASFFEKLSARQVIIFGCIFIFCVTTFNTLQGRYFNFLIYQNGARDLLSGSNPYIHWPYHLDVFVYGPLFGWIFQPICMLPSGLGNILWNTINGSLLLLGIFALPHLSIRQKKRIFTYSLPIILQAVFANQYNILVTAGFLWAYILLERKQFFIAICIICLSGFIKLYGFFHLLLLLFYPQKIKNIGYLIFWSVLFFCIPLLSISLSEIINLYPDWMHTLQNRHHLSIGSSIFNFINIFHFDYKSYRTYTAIGVWIFICLFATILYLKNPFVAPARNKIGMQAIIMIYCILFSHVAEANTYIISLLGYAYFYEHSEKKSLLDRILYILIFIFYGLMPIDIITPEAVFFWFRDTGIIALCLFISWIRIFAYLIKTPYPDKHILNA